MQDDPTEIQIAPLDIPVGEYMLILQSYDDNGSQKLTLKEDLITIQVLPQVLKRDTPVPKSVSIQLKTK